MISSVRVLLHRSQQRDHGHPSCMRASKHQPVKHFAPFPLGVGGTTFVLLRSPPAEIHRCYCYYLIHQHAILESRLPWVTTTTDIIQPPERSGAVSRRNRSFPLGCPPTMSWWRGGASSLEQGFCFDCGETWEWPIGGHPTFISIDDTFAVLLETGLSVTLIDSLMK